MPASTTTPYITAEDVLNYARSISNDANQSLGGNILADDQPYIFELLEGEYEKLQDRLITGGVNTYNETQTVTGLTPYQGPDPVVNVQLAYTGYFDGVTSHATPQLPADLLMPLEIWERHTGSNAAWCLMTQAADALASHSPSSYFRVWDWEQDILFLPASTFSNDLKIKYLLLAPRLTGPTSPVLVARSKIALANGLAAAAIKMRGGNPAPFLADADLAVKDIITRTGRKNAYASYNRKPFRGRGRRGWV